MSPAFACALSRVSTCSFVPDAPPVPPRLTRVSNRAARPLLKEAVAATGGAMNDCTPPSKLVQLPDATREDQIERWGLDATQRWEGVSRKGYGPDSEGDPGFTHSDHSAGTTHLGLPERAYLSEAKGSWGLAWAGSEEFNGGLRAPRNAEEDAYVDPDVLRFGIEARLGFTAEQVASVYRQGPLSAEARAMRARIDERLLDIAEDGGNMTLLGRLLGLNVTPDGHCRAIQKALVRAREAA